MKIMRKYFTLLCAALMGLSAYAQDAYDPAEHTVVVSGSQNFCSGNWTSEDAMTYDEASGLWKITLAAKDDKVIEFKVVYDGSWYGNNGDDNYRFLVEEPSDVTITFDPVTFVATYSGDKVKEYNPNQIDFIVAAGSAGLLNGVNWGVELPDAEANKLVAEDEGYYTLTIKGVEAGSYNFKFAANGSWAKQWGAGAQTAVENGVALAAVEGSNPPNFDLVLPKGAIYDVTLTLDIMDTSAPTVTAEWVVAGTAEIKDDVYSIAGAMNGWSETDTETEMVQTAENVYSHTFTGLAAGTYEYKVVVNHSWTGAYGGSYAGQEGDNASFTIEEPSDVTIILDLTSATPELKVNTTVSVGIQSLEAARRSEAIYTLSGQRVSKAVRGIYVINGKKVVK